jgi:putative hydrolase of the HAD superfamily
MGTTVKAIIFDFNDTISPDNFVSSFEQHAQLLSMPAREAVSLYMGNGMLRSLMLGEITEQEFWQKLSCVAKIPIGVLMRVGRTIRDSRRLDPAVMRLVAWLHPYYRLALLTDNSRETFSVWVNRYGLETWFDAILNSAEYAMLKSNPEFYRLCLHRLQCDASEALLVDDSRNNIRLAGSLGLKTIHFSNSGQLRDELEKADLLPNGTH